MAPSPWHNRRESPTRNGRTVANPVDGVNGPCWRRNSGYGYRSRGKADANVPVVHEQPTEVVPGAGQQNITSTGSEKTQSTCFDSETHTPPTEDGGQTIWASQSDGDATAQHETGAQRMRTREGEAAGPRPPAQDAPMAGVLANGVGMTLTHMAKAAPIQQRPTCFHSEVAPGMPIDDYFARLCACMGCSHECYVIGLVYIDRVTKLHPELVFSPFSCHRLAATAMVAAAKFQDDRYYNNALYAQVAGISLQELNLLERCFMQLLGWRLVVVEEEYKIYADMISQAVFGWSPQTKEA